MVRSVVTRTGVTLRTFRIDKMTRNGLVRVVLHLVETTPTT